ncbi:molybdopterin converting factor subunit 1 [Thalassotalea fusca]
MITVHFFALFREQLNCDRIELDAQELSTVADISAHLAEKFDDWHKLTSTYQVLAAVNQTMVDVNTPVKSGDEVAFFPPVTGG